MTTTARKITTLLPADLIDQAQKVSKKNLTETIKMGLRMVAAQKTYQDLLKMQGKVALEVDWQTLKEDR